ncbi:MAG: 4Fe-4S dicluster domain-containing protein [Candidatus Brockarchaeota archaeon]|nr:4Fe-4S dicluster domain-containing protein [Candidatus Brockarchaeota archaeon]
MVIDLKKCIGCMTCTVACEVENLLPRGVVWGRVTDFECGNYPNVERVYLPMPCMHCEEPACMKACPTEAITRREDGIVLTDYEKCNGCRLCMIACPYDSRMYIDKINLPEPLQRLRREVRSAHQILREKTVSKCTFCVHRIDKAKEGKIPGKDPEATPLCVNTCVGNARYFGDLDDPESNVSKLAKSSRAFVIYEEAKTRPSVYYLSRRES